MSFSNLFDFNNKYNNRHSLSAFEASGRQWRWEDRVWNWEQNKTAAETTFDSDGRAAKVTNLTSHRTGGSNWTAWAGVSEYSIYSSVTGLKVATAEYDGAHKETSIHLGSTPIVIKDTNGTRFQLTDPVSGSTRDVQSSGEMFADDDQEHRNELAGLGTSIPPNEPAEDFPPPHYKGGGYAVRAEHGCMVNGSLMSDMKYCTDAIRNRSGVPDKNHDHPIQLGYWKDEKDPRPQTPTNPEWEAADGVITSFVPFGNLFWQATVSFEQDDIVPLPKSVAVETLLINRQCAKFTEDLIQQVGKETGNSFTSDYVPDLLGSIEVDFSQQYGTRTNSDGTKYQVPVAGRTYERDSKTGITMIGISPKSSRNITDVGRYRANYDYLLTYIHEAIHSAGSNGRYTDRQLADAIVSLNQNGSVSLPKSALEQYKSILEEDVDANSRWFETVLQLHCPAPDGTRIRVFPN